MAAGSHDRVALRLSAASQGRRTPHSPLKSSVSLEKSGDLVLIPRAVQLLQQLIRAQLVQVTPPTANPVVPDPVAPGNTPRDVAPSAHGPTLAPTAIHGQSDSRLDDPPYGALEARRSSSYRSSAALLAISATGRRRGSMARLWHASCSPRALPRLELSPGWSTRTASRKIEPPQPRAAGGRSGPS